jgi:glycerate-2-kinase
LCRQIEYGIFLRKRVGKVMKSSLIACSEQIWQAGLDGVAPGYLIGKCVKIKKNRLEFSGFRHPSESDDIKTKSLNICARSRFSQKKTIDLSKVNNIYLIAFGKAAPAMATGLMEVLGQRIHKGIVVALPGKKISLPKMKILEAPHPLPDERSLEAGREILALARSAGEKDLIILLLSGGGSAQVCLPLPGISLREKRKVTSDLLLRGADITELNIVRKHLSLIKGGRLAEAAYPAEVVSLIISDVIGDDLEAIASGPFSGDSSTYADVLRILKKYDLWESEPQSIKNVINEGRQGRIAETPKKENKIFDRVSSFVIGNNATALDSARTQVEKLGFRVHVLTSTDRGEAQKTARSYVSLFLSLAWTGDRTGQPLCLLGGGELTVSVKGRGKGGRNQEFVLAALSELEKQAAGLRRVDPDLSDGFRKTSLLHGREWLIASLGTDGIDGNTDVAGAWASPENLHKSRSLGLNIQNYLDANDSFHFFKQAGGLIITGPTGTNVMDMRIILLK